MVKTWVAPGHDAAQLKSLAAESTSVVEFLSRDYQSFKEYGTWSETLADPDSEFGKGVIECALTHEHKAGPNCVWFQDIVVGGDANDEPRVLLVNQEFKTTEGRRNPSCQAYAACIAEQWQYRKAPPFPRGANPYLSLHALGTPATIQGTNGDANDYLEYYQKMRKYAADEVSTEQKALDAHYSDSGAHNLRLSKAMLRHVDAMLEKMQG